MRRVVVLVALLLLASFPMEAQEAPIAFVGVSVVDVVRGRVEPDQTVVVEGDRIVGVGRRDQVAVPAGARTVDGRGRFLIPGLWDMHVHAVNPGIQELFLPLLIANGITGVREMWSRVEWLDSARVAIERGKLAGPRLIGAGNLVDGKPQIWPGSLGAADPDEGRRLVDSLHRAGAGFIKVYSRLSPETYGAIAEEAKRLGIPFEGHVPTLVSPAEASDLGQLTIEHLTMIPQACSSLADEFRREVGAVVASKGWDSAGAAQRLLGRRMSEAYDAEACRSLARRFVKNGTWMVPTMTVLRSTSHLDDTTLAADLRLRFIPGFFKLSWDPRRDFRFRMLTAEDWATRKRGHRRQIEIVGLLHREGVRFLAGTDLSNPYIYPGFSLHDELANMVEAGMSPLDALRTATLNPAVFLGQEREAGTVETGKRADLVLLDANPLDDIKNTTRIRAVVAAGRLYDDQALAELVAAGEATAKKMSGN
jgi:imidazolonepropionase-like amidohydrolase